MRTELMIATTLMKPEESTRTATAWTTVGFPLTLIMTGYRILKMLTPITTVFPTPSKATQTAMLMEFRTYRIPILTATASLMALKLRSVARIRTAMTSIIPMMLMLRVV